MAERFARGGRLIAIGVTPAARSDVRHVAVEFVHPVIVGKRALPALGLTGESARLERELYLVAERRRHRDRIRGAGRRARAVRRAGGGAGARL